MEPRHRRAEPLAGAVLIGIGFNALLGWWWADPLAGLVIAYYGLTEGRAAWKMRTDRPC
jgi:divalent metal cation (Fe/Co/Zn/Cd) transporter